MKLWETMTEWYYKYLIKKKGNEGDKVAKNSLYWFNHPGIVPWSVYDGHNKKHGEINKKHWFIHNIFKYRIFHLMINLIRKVVWKYIEQDVPKEHYNKPMQIFDQAWDNTMKDWVYTYLKPSQEHSPEDQDREYKNFCDVNKSSHTLMTLKRMVLAIPMNDTAYSEFMYRFMYHLYGLMHKEYGGKVGKHINYHSDTAFDMVYYAITKEVYKDPVTGETKVDAKLIDTGKMSDYGKVKKPPEPKKCDRPWSVDGGIPDKKKRKKKNVKSK